MNQAGFVEIFIGPVGHRWTAADQFRSGPAHHATEGRVHINDLSIQISGPHARVERVFHGLAKGVFLAQLFLHGLPT